MGVDCIAILPFRARLRDVAHVVGILAGLPAEQYSIDGSNGVFVQVPGVTTKGSETIPEMPAIDLKAPDGTTLADKQRAHFVHYHYEGDSAEGPEMHPPSTPFWIAVMRGVVQFFGGALYYQDCGYGPDVAPDFTHEEQPDIRATNGEEWDAFQRRKLALRPITKADMKALEEAAAY